MSSKTVQKQTKARLGEILLEWKLITPEKLDVALKEQAALGKTHKLGQILVNLGFISEHDVFRALSFQLGLQYLKFSEFPRTIPEGSYPTVKFLKEYKLVPIGIENNKMRVAMSDPLDEYALEALRVFSGKPFEIVLGSEKDILEAIEQYFGANVQMTTIMEGMREEEMEADVVELEEDVHHLRDMAFEAPIVKLVNMLITRAVEGRASDIHIEPFESNVKIRYRIDGALNELDPLPKRIQAAVISRIKIMSRLNIAERRLPQDGRIKLRVSGRDVDLRVSSMPTIYGESIVMRILDSSSALIDLEHLGFPGDTQPGYRKLITLPYGMLLVTGPTGSGKTTTLYASLSEINLSDKKIITIEDPIEYQIEGINQIQVKPRIGLTFANGLRHIVRQDPDIIMVGEIRDIETAEISIHSALTGHLVFSTLHTNDAPGALTRLLDMGIENFLVSSSLAGVLAQRLVRVICRSCKEPFTPRKEIIEKIGALGPDITTYHGTGCEECRNTGYRGRTGIFELMIMTEDIRKLVVDKTGSDVIRQKAISQGMATLRESGWQKVKDGLTTVEEVLRVTQEEI
ncbi:type II secretion system protein E [bacterium BMS3Abin10]|nr:type II secretion system protein E [bacterium BMS3Abin10]GBE39147.1 type II secretion system protein E [bacterium BMS3Bbin08]HDH51636.1 type II secretion system protein GspE [Nitrospirota bacterium]HDK41523.1 type II secretion system protein GspE [Nitrospirota bacterium]